MFVSRNSQLEALRKEESKLSLDRFAGNCLYTVVSLLFDR